jgi:hypothetical protein
MKINYNLQKSDKIALIIGTPIIVVLLAYMYEDAVARATVPTYIILLTIFVIMTFVVLPYIALRYRRQSKQN